MKFNRNKPYGEITPPYRGASFQQGDQYYDADFKRIAELSKAPKLREVQPVDLSPIGAVEAKLIMMAEDPDITWQEFRKASRGALDECPTTKDKIVEALKDQIVQQILAKHPYSKATPQDPSAPSVEAAEDEFKGMTWGDESGKKSAVPPAPPEEDDDNPIDPGDMNGPEAAEAPNDGPVDLAAWGKGRAPYLFSDVQKAIREKFARQVSKKIDAVDLLIDEGVIPVVEAMQVSPDE